MAKDGLFFKSVANVHKKFGVPSNSIILQCIIAVVLVLSGTFEQVLTYMGFALGIFPILTVIGVWKLRKNNPDALQVNGISCHSDNIPYDRLPYSVSVLP